MIDPHVHLRDWNQSSKETLRHGFEVAWNAGISGLFEMPNTDPPLTTKQNVERRCEEADAVLTDIGLPLFHGLYVGLTDDADQVSAALDLHRRLFPRVVGFKLYAGHSTGRMGITATQAQWSVWKHLAADGYRGVVAIHAEREDLLRPDLWDPANPETHLLARPSLAEVASVQTQIDLADAAGFRGHLHICHVSVPDTVTLVRGEGAGLGFGISLGVTPHHVLLSQDVASKSDIPEWNVNPPLRTLAERDQLMEMLLAGQIDWIESDHAPHTMDDKRKGASGLPGLPAYRLLVDRLRSDGIAGGPDVAGTDGTPPRDDADRSGVASGGRPDLHALTIGNVCRVFQLDPEGFGTNPNSPLVSPGTSYDYAAAAAEYPWDPYR